MTLGFLENFHAPFIIIIIIIIIIIALIVIRAGSANRFLPNAVAIF